MVMTGKVDLWHLLQDEMVATGIMLLPNPNTSFETNTSKEKTKKKRKLKR